jgi:photosystem II stability/assembly factor-like uncharacterized protein
MGRRGLWLIGVVVALLGATGLSAVAATRGVQLGSVSGYRLALARLIAPQFGLVALNPTRGAVSARLLVTTSSGTHFRAIGPRLPKDSVIDDVFLLDRRHGWLAAWNTDTVDVTVYRTRDGGQHWHSTITTSHTGNAGAVATIQFITPRTGWLVNEQPTAPKTSLYASTDGGARWRLVAGHLPETAPVLFTSSSTAWQAGGLFSFALERTRDGGRRWTRMQLPVPAAERSAHALVGAPARFGAAILVPVTYLHRGHADLALYTTTDDGDRWTLASLHTAGASTSSQGCQTFAGLPAPLAVSLTSASSWWVGYRKGAWFVDRTANAGKSWQTYLITRARSVAYCPPLPNLQALDAQTAWFTVMAGGPAELFTTANGGRQWRQVQP